MIRSGAAEAQSGGGSEGGAGAELVGLLFGSAEEWGNGEAAEGAGDIERACVPQCDA